MGVGYDLVNYTKKEVIRYRHIPAKKAREIAGNSVAAAITTWYMLKNRGDQISFITDTYEDWPFPGTIDEVEFYREVTEETVESLIQAGVLVDEGREYYFADDPEIFDRKLRNIWMDG